MPRKAFHLLINGMSLCRFRREFMTPYKSDQLMAKLNGRGVLLMCNYFYLSSSRQFDILDILRRTLKEINIKCEAVGFGLGKCPDTFRVRREGEYRAERNRYEPRA